MAGGWVKVYREFTEWEWYSNVNVSRVFFHLLLTANHKETKWQGQVILPGQKVTSYENLAAETNLSVKQVRVALDKLKASGTVAVKRTNRFSIISIVNWRKYQDEGFPDGIQNDKPMAIKGQTDGKQRATNKNEKNDKNEKNIVISSAEDKQAVPAKPQKHRYGEHKNVLLTDDEVEKLKAKFGSSYQEFLDKFSNGLALKGYKYKSHYLRMLKWFKDEVPQVSGNDLIMQGMNIVPIYGGQDG